MAGGLDLDGHADLHALERVLERDADARLEVGAPLGLRSPRPLAAPEERAEVAEQVGEVAEIDVLGSGRRPDRTRPAARGRCRAEAVVRLALLGVREDVVGGLDVLEPLLRGRVVRIAVGMELAGELPVRLLELVVGRRLRDAEDGVGVAGRHSALLGPSATTTRAGRSTASPIR